MNVEELIGQPITERNRMAKKQYYDISNLLSTKAQYMMLLGQRANGKSYQVKKTMLEAAYNKEKKFVYLRRWKADITTSAVESYFEDMPINKITSGEYDKVKAWRNNIYFCTVEDDGKEVRGPMIGRYCALNEAERYKSWVFTKDFEYIDFEEFITDRTYLVDEPAKLQQFVSTVARLESLTVFLIGNTLNRVCPYFSEWCLDGVLKQKQGTIDVYHFHVDNTVIDIAVEYCTNTKNDNKMFFGQTAKQIVTGEWDTRDVPKLPKPIETYDMVYELLVVYQKFKFVMQLLIEPVEGGRIVYIYPFTGHRTIERIISDEFTDNLNQTSKLDIKRRPEAIIAECFRMNKVCYSDNLTGSDFRSVNMNMRLA